MGGLGKAKTARDLMPIWAASFMARSLPTRVGQRRSYVSDRLGIHLKGLGEGA